MEILAHRAIGFGEPENSRGACEKALAAGMGLEIDVRLSHERRLVISHDEPGQDAWVFEDAIPVLQQSRHPIAIHLKDQSRAAWQPLARAAASMPQAFLFDVRIDTAQQIRAEFPSVQLGFSVADYDGEPTLYPLREVLARPECNIIWWDEWVKTGSLYQEDALRQIRAAGKKVFAISPELHATTSPRHTQAGTPETSWALLKLLAVDGICTDYSRRATAFFNS